METGGDMRTMRPSLLEVPQATVPASATPTPAKATPAAAAARGSPAPVNTKKRQANVHAAGPTKRKGKRPKQGSQSASAELAARKDRWNRKFELLCAFRRENGHCRVPCSFEVEAVKLGHWVHDQRAFYKKFMKGHGQAAITQDRIDQLNSIGFEWSLKKGGRPLEEASWNHKFELLRAFADQHGHCRVPQDFEVESVKLGLWAGRQRFYHSNFKKGEGKACITQERINLLNSIGFEWSLDAPRGITWLDSEWNHRFQLLLKFWYMNGHCRVPQHFKDDSVKLGQWVPLQRMHYRDLMKGQHIASLPITQERIDKLNSIAFEWSLPEQTS